MTLDSFRFPFILLLRCGFFRRWLRLRLSWLLTLFKLLLRFLVRFSVEGRLNLFLFRLLLIRSVLASLLLLLGSKRRLWLTWAFLGSWSLLRLWLLSLCWWCKSFVWITLRNWMSHSVVHWLVIGDGANRIRVTSLPWHCFTVNFISIVRFRFSMEVKHTLKISIVLIDYLLLQI